MYFPILNKKLFFYKILPSIFGSCLFLLIASSAFGKTGIPISNQKNHAGIKNKLEVLAQRFDSNDSEGDYGQAKAYKKMGESIEKIEKALEDLKESFEQLRSNQSTVPIRGGHRMGRGRHGMGHGGMMGHGGHGRMHGRRFKENVGPECPQPRNTLKVPDSLYNLVNPLENTPENIEAGRILFQMEVQPTCTMCHGFGDGRGIMADTLSPPPRNFSCAETMRDIPDGQLFGVITNGSEGTGMPAFFDLDDDQIWKLILYIRSLAK